MQARTNSTVGDLPRYNEIHIDQEIFITPNASRSNVAPRRPTYSVIPAVYSPSGSSHSEYSQSSHDRDTPATSIERSSDPVSEETMANLDVMLVSRNVSLVRRQNEEGSMDVMTDRMAHRELVDFLRTCEPPPDNFMSVPENFTNINRKGSFKIFARRKAHRSKSGRLLRLPDSAVAATTTHGHRHIAISIREQQAHPELVSQYQYYAPVKAPDPQSRTPQKLYKSPPRVAGSANPNLGTVSSHPLAKTGTVTVRRPVVEQAVSRTPNRNSSVHVNVQRGPWSTEPSSAAQGKLLALRSREPSNAPATIGVDNARLLQKFWEQHPPPEDRHELVATNHKHLLMPEGAHGSPGRQGSETTDPRHSGGTAYSERTLGTATVSGGHSRESSGNSNSGKQPSGAKVVMIRGHSVRASSRTRDLNTMPLTPRQFALKASASSNGTARTTTLEGGSSEISPSRTVIPAETHNGDNDLVSLSGFLASSPYSSHKPPQPGPAPNRKLPDLPEGSDVSRNGSCSSNNNRRPSMDPASLSLQTARSVSKSPSRVGFEKASRKKETADYPDHPANRSAPKAVQGKDGTTLSLSTAHQLRQERVRAKKQRDIAHLKGLNVKAQYEQSRAVEGLSVRDGEGSQQQSISSMPGTLSASGTIKGSVRNARKRSEALLPAPLDLSKIPSFGTPLGSAGNGDMPQTSKSLPAAAQTETTTGNSLPAGSYGSGSGKGSVRHARKKIGALMSPLAKVEASFTSSSTLENPSLRAAANALTSIMQVSEAKSQGLGNIPHLPPPITSEGRTELVNTFPLPPKSEKRYSHGVASSNSVEGSSAHNKQAAPRSPSPSLQSSDEEGSLNDGRATGVGISLKSPPRSQIKSSSKSTVQTPTLKVRSGSVGIPVIPSVKTLQRKSSNVRRHSRTGSTNSDAQSQNTHPSSSYRSTSNSTTQALNNSESLRAAIDAFELHRATRRQERHRYLRDRRAREIVHNNERAAHDEEVSRRFAQGDKKHEAVLERLQSIEGRDKEQRADYIRMCELTRKTAQDMEELTIMVHRMHERITIFQSGAATHGQSQVSVSANSSELMSPVVGKMGMKGMRIDISMPPSSCGDPTPASLTTSSGLGLGRRLPFAENDIDIEEEEEACPQYEGHGKSKSLGGDIPGRSSTPIESLIEEIQSSSSSSAAAAGKHRFERPKRKGRGSRDGDVKYEGLLYDGSGWSGEETVVADAERGLMVSE